MTPDAEDIVGKARAYVARCKILTEAGKELEVHSAIAAEYGAALLRAVEALEWYAKLDIYDDIENGPPGYTWQAKGKILEDEGERARECLASLGGKA